MKTIKDVLDEQLQRQGVPRCINSGKWEDYDISRTKVLVGQAIEDYASIREVEQLEFA